MTTARTGDIFQPGDLLNNTYRIETILGRGGTSEVYKARSEISGRVIAIKALRAEYATNEDFLVLMTREEDIRDVSHPAIVRYFDTQRMPDGVVYLVMDYVDGAGLDRKLAEGGLPASDLLVVGARVCEGLIAAHERNIVHRDLSPDNIILRNNMPSEAVIIDFGIAKDTNPGAETIVGNEFAGKYAYAAPEQLSGRTDARSDIYSLGVLLLATFRGQKPDIGNNPMEVVEKKALPLDLDGVPEPLNRLISRMCAPNPDNRFASAKALQEAFRNPDNAGASAQVVGAAAPLEDATVIAPVAASRAEPAPIGLPESASETTAPQTTGSEAPTKGRGKLIALLATVLLLLGAGGGYFAGIFDGAMGPRYPLADPYMLILEKASGGALHAAGNIPTPEIESTLNDILSETGGTAELSLATGDISEEWGPAMLDVLEDARGLEEFQLSLEGGALRLTGLAADRATLEAVTAAISDGRSAGFDSALDLQLGPRFLSANLLTPILRERADCGPLQLLSPPPVGYGLEDRVIVTGRFAEAGTRDALQADITDLAGDRPVRIEGEVLNPSLCRIDAALPQARSGGFEVRMGYGERSGENVSGRYAAGDNPVIDIVLPQDVQDGYLWVSVVDVKGLVFHLLPNNSRQNNRISSLRAQAEDRVIRVAYALAEAEGNDKLAFRVDGSVGKSKIVVLSSDEPLFDELRPTTESVASYAQALTKSRETAGAVVRSLDFAILTTEE